MSANNWDICPRCKKILLLEQEEKKIAAKEAYGKVSADRYAALLKESEIEPDFEESMREDWQIGVSKEGEFYVSYSCECANCGFSFSFKHDEQLSLE